MKIMICDYKGVLTGYYFDYNIPTTIYGFVALKNLSKSMKIGRKIVWQPIDAYTLKFIDMDGVEIPAIQLTDEISHSVIPEYFKKCYGIKVRVWSAR